MTAARFFASCAVVASLSAAASAQVSDAVGDFLASYTGPHNADVDAVRADVVVIPDVDRVFVDLHVNGFMGTTPGVLYVFGIDRGAGSARFQSGAPRIGANVLFDAVVIFSPQRTGQVVDLVTNTATAIDPVQITVGPKEMSALFPLSLLPSRGRPPEQYTYNLWPRVGSGSNAQVADFLPDASNARVGVLPCPGDANGDRVVDLDDVVTVLAHIGTPATEPPPAGDVDFDLDVDLDDLLIVIGNFGAQC